MSRQENDEVAARLDEIAAILTAQSANPFRVRAYRQAADTLRRLAVPVSQILLAEGIDGLDRIRGVGPSLARTIRDIVVHGYSPILQRLRGESDPVRLFTSVPGIGPRLAGRLHDEMGLDTLPQLEAAAYDGRLEQIAGVGPKRLTGIRDTLARRLGSTSAGGGSAGDIDIPVGELLDVDREYRDRARAGELHRIAPHRFNPRHDEWLPILHTERHGRHYTALFSNTARAHRLGMTGDWVVLYCDDGPREHQWTVITAAFGPLHGRRIVRGRERECATFYEATTPGMPADKTAVQVAS
jgi:putative hydrolase